MIKSFTLRRSLLATLAVLLACVFWLPVPQVLHAQGYSFAAPYPNIATPASGLTITYGSGSVVVGGLVQSITGSTVVATNTMTDCQAPSFSGCNFIYWPGSGTSLSITTTYATAFASGNVVVAYATATGGNVTAITPATLNVPPASPQTYGYTDGAYWVGPGECNTTVTGGSTGTNGLTTNGASGTPVIQAQTSATASNFHMYRCNIYPPTRISSTGRGVSIVDATFFYGNQAQLDPQAAVLASGTMNGQIVFTSITYPAAGAGETPSTVTPVRADSGTLTIAPAVASFNITTTTAGSFFSVKFTPATAIALQTDLVQLFLNVKLSLSLGIVTASPGVLVHYKVIN